MYGGKPNFPPRNPQLRVAAWEHSPPFYTHTHTHSVLRDFERDSNNSKQALRNPCFSKDGRGRWIDRTWELLATKNNAIVN